jgi:hypothetical protein
MVAVTMMRKLNGWTLDRMTLLNREILERRMAPEVLVAELNREVLPLLPAAEYCTVPMSRQLMVNLGLWGSSVGRHFQERDPKLKSCPHISLHGLDVGGRGYIAYMETLAGRAAPGHPPRDTYASLVRWNTPNATVRWSGGERVLAGCFDDGQVRSYTGDRGEVEFFVLLKKCEVIEKAINELVQPLCCDDLDVTGPEAIERMRQAVELLTLLHQVNLDFAHQLQPRALRPAHFMDVMRQFAVHWTAGDVPPSGAQDVEFLVRDALLGIDFPGYVEHVRRIFPSLLACERDRFIELSAGPTLPDLVLSHLGVTPADLSAMGPNSLLEVARGHPALAACYLVLVANSRVSAVHLMLTKKYLFKPQQKRDQEGLPDGVVVSNRAGTTGMLELLLESLHRARMRHPLVTFNQLPKKVLHAIADVMPAQPEVVCGI